MRDPLTAIVVSAALACAAPALAACPPPGSLETGGIRIAYNNGMWEVFRRHAPGVVQVVGLTDAGPVHVMWLSGGVFLIKVSNFDAAGEVAEELLYDYAEGLDALPGIEPGLRRTIAAEVTATSGEVFGQRQRVAIDPPENVVISGCVMEAIPIRITYLGGDPYAETLHYLPDYEISYLYASRFGVSAPEISRAMMITLVD